MERSRYPAFVASCLALATLLLTAPVAIGQATGDAGPDATDTPETASPQSERPKASAGKDPAEVRKAHLDSLFAQLADADNPNWERVQGQIWSTWRESGSPSMNLLLNRASRAMENKAYDRALDFLDDLVRLAPDFAEAWNMRATVHFLTGSYGRSMADIERTLALEPRHFGAMAGLGIILDRTGNEAGALGVYRRVIELHPNMEGAREGIDRLAPEIDGRSI
ncbi:MAG: tetratricopeptide repeat protein [Pseudomonadota bacterium]